MPKPKAPPVTTDTTELIHERGLALVELMDAISELHEALHEDVLRAIPVAIRTHLDLALRRAKNNTMHGFEPWS